MPVVLFRKDPFLGEPYQYAGAERAAIDARGVRRPLYGYVPKADRYASLSVTQVTPGTGSQVPVSILDSSAPAQDSGGYAKSNRNTNFFVTQISHVDSEKFQIVETFGDDYVFFFGRRPFMLQVSGVLMNTADFNWKSEWLQNYETYLRGTKCVENRCRVHFRVDERLYSGYIVNTQTQDTAETTNATMFGFQMLVYSQTDLYTERTVSLAGTHVVGEKLYVDYVDGELPGSLQIWEINQLTGNSERHSVTNASYHITEKVALLRMQSVLEGLVDTQNVAFIEGASRAAAPYKGNQAIAPRGVRGPTGIRGGACNVADWGG